MQQVPGLAPVGVTRRAILMSGAVGVGTLSGCVGWADWFGPDPGDVVVTNRDYRPHTIVVTVTKVSEDSRDTKCHDERPDPETDPIWERELEFVVDAGDEVTEEAVVTDPGAYFVEAVVEGGGGGFGWIGYYEAANGIGEDTIYVSVQELDRITVYGSHSD